MEVLRWYGRSLKTKPKTTKILSALFLNYTSNCVCQYIEKPRDKHYFEVFDNRRAVNLSLFGAGFITPLFHYWHNYLALKFPSKTLTAVFFKALGDRLTVGSFAVFSFFVSQHYMNGGNTADLKVKLKRDFPKALEMNVTVWMGALMVNFKYMPLEFQAVFLSTVAFFWMIYLSWAMNVEKHISNKTKGL